VPQNQAPAGTLSRSRIRAVSELSVRRACAWAAGGMLPNAVVWVAEIDGEVAGYLASRGTDLDHLYVAVECQGRGVGSLLLSKAKELSPEGLELYAFQRNTRARAFYEARGFVAVAFSDGANNEEQEPDVRYAWPGRA
jgi:ribosomal protein S18 acetylase RimI-like enzyme